MFPPHAHIWAPTLFLTAVALRECGNVYQYIFRSVLRHDKAMRGLDHDHPSVPQLRMHAAGASAAAAVGSVTYFATATLLERAMSATSPDPRRLFDAPLAAPPPITLRRALAALSPHTATRSSVAAFFTAHGLQLMARSVAFGWAFLVLSPAAHAATMGLFAHENTHEEQRASKWGREYRASTEEVVDLMDELQRKRGERGGGNRGQDYAPFVDGTLPTLK